MLRWMAVLFDCRRLEVVPAESQYEDNAKIIRKDGTIYCLVQIVFRPQRSHRVQQEMKHADL